MERDYPFECGALTFWPHMVNAMTAFARVRYRDENQVYHHSKPADIL